MQDAWNQLIVILSLGVNVLANELVLFKFENNDDQSSKHLA